VVEDRGVLRASNNRGDVLVGAPPLLLVVVIVPAPPWWWGWGVVWVLAGGSEVGLSVAPDLFRQG
jgi:hypothetical protein